METGRRLNRKARPAQEKEWERAVMVCILTRFFIKLPDLGPVLVAAGDFERHETAATGFGPKLAAAFESALQLGAEGFHGAAARAA
jgi:hypothetical protein